MINKAETYRSYKRALQVLVFNILNSDVFSLRQFEDVLFSVDDFHGSIWQPFSNVTCNDFSKPSKTHSIYSQTTNLTIYDSNAAFIRGKTKKRKDIRSRQTRC